MRTKTCSEPSLGPYTHWHLLQKPNQTGSEDRRKTHRLQARGGKSNLFTIGPGKSNNFQSPVPSVLLVKVCHRGTVLDWGLIFSKGQGKTIAPTSLASQSHTRAEVVGKVKNCFGRSYPKGPSPGSHQKIPDHCLVVLVPFGPLLQ